MEKRILRLKEVVQVSGLSRSTIYSLMSVGKFPKPLKLSLRASGWLMSDIEDWIQSRVEARGSSTHNPEKS